MLYLPETEKKEAKERWSGVTGGEERDGLCNAENSDRGLLNLRTKSEGVDGEGRSKQDDRGLSGLGDIADTGAAVDNIGDVGDKSEDNPGDAGDTGTAVDNIGDVGERIIDAGDAKDDDDLVGVMGCTDDDRKQLDNESKCVGLDGEVKESGRFLGNWNPSLGEPNPRAILGSE